MSRIVRKTVYNMLTHMCNFFDGDGSCARHPYIYELLCELLSWPTLAKEFCADEGEFIQSLPKRSGKLYKYCLFSEKGVRSLFNTLLETFPIDFVHLSMLASALTKAGMSNFVSIALGALPITLLTFLLAF